MKKYSYIFSFIIITMQTIFAFEEQSLFINQKYEFIEREFITHIAVEKNNFWANVLATIPVTLGIFAACNLADGNEKTLTKENIVLKNLLTHTHIYSFILLGCAGFSASTILNKYITNKAHYNAVKKFFSRWKKNKRYTPDLFLETFESIALEIEKKGDRFIAKNANKIVETIQFIITRHFHARYDNILKINAYNAIAETKSILEILQAFVSGAKDLAV